MIWFPFLQVCFPRVQRRLEYSGIYEFRLVFQWPEVKLWPFGVGFERGVYRL